MFCYRALVGALIFSCPADHVPDWQPRRILLGMAEARSVNNVKNTTTVLLCTYMTIKVAVNTVWILSKSCMFFWVFRFAKNTNFLLNKGGIHFFSKRIFRVQFRFSQVPRLVEFLDRIYLVQT